MSDLVSSTQPVPILCLLLCFFARPYGMQSCGEDIRACYHGVVSESLGLVSDEAVKGKFRSVDSWMGSCLSGRQVVG
jgi:hypothetical protein